MVAGEFVLQARKQRLNRIYLPTYFQARVDSWVAQSKMSYDGCKTKADTVKDFQMDVIFKMISSSITKVDKVHMSSINNKQSLSLSVRMPIFHHCILYYRSTFR
uniref:Uncharacterized protein n=2 Tax=Opuntia streptacantha TaxID=393608 RepID=A0A7C8ZJL2_OPUST